MPAFIQTNKNSSNIVKVMSTVMFTNLHFQKTMEEAPGNSKVKSLHDIYAEKELRVTVGLMSIVKAEFDEAWPTMEKLYEEIDSSAMKGTEMTKLFQTLLASVPPKLVN